VFAQISSDMSVDLVVAYQRMPHVPHQSVGSLVAFTTRC
jgi:hypothetical protein